jgi:hypothetical protein
MRKRRDRRRKIALGPENISAREAGLVITVGRRQAIMSELDTAIFMWLSKLDPLSTHLVVMAAHECLCNIGGESKGPTARQHVGKNTVNLAYDWLRHASRDPNDIFDFPPRINEVALWDSIGSFIRIFGITTNWMDAFLAYFALHLGAEDPNVRENAHAFLPEGVTIDEVDRLNSGEFFVKMLPLFAAFKLAAR